MKLKVPCIYIIFENCVKVIKMQKNWCLCQSTLYLSNIIPSKFYKTFLSFLLITMYVHDVIKIRSSRCPFGLEIPFYQMVFNLHIACWRTACKNRTIGHPNIFRLHYIVDNLNFVINRKLYLYTRKLNMWKEAKIFSKIAAQNIHCMQL